MTLALLPTTIKPLIDTLRHTRRAKGVSTHEVDDRAGFGNGLVEKMEDGRRQPSVQALAYWAEALGARLLIVPPLPLTEIETWCGRPMAPHQRCTSVTHAHRQCQPRRKPARS